VILLHEIAQFQVIKDTLSALQWKVLLHAAYLKEHRLCSFKLSLISIDAAPFCWPTFQNI